MTLNWAAKLKEILEHVEPILAETPFVPGSSFVYNIESSLNDEMISEFAKIIRQSDIQAIGRALRGQDYESKDLTEIRKEVQKLQVKLSRAKLAKNKQEIKKLEDELNLAISTFSQTKMFETLASEPTKQRQIIEGPIFSDIDYSTHWRYHR